MREQKKTKITLEFEDNKFSFEVPEDLDAYEMVDILKLIMYALTFHPDTVEDLFREE